MPTRYRVIVTAAVILSLLAGCGKVEPAATVVPSSVTAAPTSFSQTATSLPPSTLPATIAPTGESGADNLSEEEAATLGSLKQVDEYPLYTMHYHGPYNRRVSSAEGIEWSKKAISSPAWGCSLFAALGDDDNMLYGRNFDWEYSPALLLFTDPPDGYASVSMVDIAYLGFGGDRADTLLDLPLAGRRALLDAPFWPFDGMNEQGLAVGLAAVPEEEVPSDSDKETVGSLMVIRNMLDHARDVDEAVTILQSYNIDFGGGPHIHYLIADAGGRSVLVEFYRGEMVIMSSETAWHLATNFLRASVGESTEGVCWRYDRLGRQLAETRGRMGTPDGMELLADVSQDITQWSIVYGMSSRDISVVMGREYDDVDNFHLNVTGE